MTTKLFDPYKLGPNTLSNRIVMAPLTRNRAPDAIPTPLMAEYYAQRASAGQIGSDRHQDVTPGSRSLRRARQWLSTRR